MSMTNSRVTYT